MGSRSVDVNHALLLLILLLTPIFVRPFPVRFDPTPLRILLCRFHHLALDPRLDRGQAAAGCCRLVRRPC